MRLSAAVGVALAPLVVLDCLEVVVFACFWWYVVALAPLVVVVLTCAFSV